MSAGSRVLLVDDDPIMRELAQAKLTEAGHAVAVAQNGAVAMELLKSEGADVVISDLEMPVMNGFDLTKAVRADPEFKDAPVIVITANNRADAVDQAFAAGATSFLAKPINWTLFTQAVKFVVRASEDQKSLRAARDQAEAGAKFKDSLMSIMSHELRTPLNAIIGFGQLLGEQLEKRGDDLHKEYADYIVDGGKRLLNSISDMLLASEARSGSIAIDEADAAVEDIIGHAKTLAAPAIAQATENITIKIQEPGLELRCDRHLMARAFAMLIENALKFSSRDVKIQLGAARTKNGGLALMIRDNGPGIEPEKLKDAAAPFTQSDMSPRRSKEGLGLGLPLAHAIASAHGASLHIDSKAGAGTRVLILMPPARIIAGANGKTRETSHNRLVAAGASR